MIRKRIFTIMIAAAAATAALAGPASKSILSLKETITDNNITYPASFETNTQAMMSNWYLQNYAIIDSLVEKRSANEVSDAEYVRRLKAIPSAIELPFNQIVRSYILRYVKSDRTLVSQMLGMSPYYMPIFEQALEREGLPLELKYIPIIESALNPNAESSAGAGGLWQFMVQTAKDLGLEVNTLVDERRDPYRSSAKAAAYFKQLYGIYGDWSLAIAAYNCGPNNVNKAIRRAKGRDVNEKTDFWEIYNYLPRETRGYVPAFIAANYAMNYYQKHNINPSLAKKPLLIDTVQVHHRINFNQISKVLNIPIEEIRILNPQYRHDVIPGDTHPYTLALPSQQIYSFILVEDSIAGYRPDLYAQREVVQPGQSAANRATGVTYDVNATSTISAKSENAGSTAQADASDGAASYHKVRRGETLKSIADDYGMTTDQLMALNGLSRNRVRRGQVLKVVRGTASQATASADEGSNSSTSASTSTSTTSSEPVQAAASSTSNSNTPAPSSSSNALVAQNTTSDSNTASSNAPVAQRGDYKDKSGNYIAYKGSYSIDDELDAEAKARQERAARRAEQQRKAREAQEARDRELAQQKAQQEREEARRAQAAAKKAKADKDDDTEWYTVKRGESLRSIADDHGITVSQLKRASGLSSSNELIAGKRIKVPAGTNAKAERAQAARDKAAAAATAQKGKSSKRRQADNDDADGTYTVKRGESIWDVAANTGVSVSALRKANGLKKSDQLNRGQKLVIPGGGSSKSTASKKRRKNADDNAQSTKSSKKNRKSRKSRKPETVTYVVKPGDSMERISRHTGVSVKELEAATGINNKTIRAGQKLKIPKK